MRVSPTSGVVLQQAPRSWGVLQTQVVGLPAPYQGKVRDVYAVGESAMLLVATDRLSAFDVVMRQGIPDKGKILTRLAAFWFEETRSIIDNHLITIDDAALRQSLADAGALWDASLSGRATLCKKTTPLKIEAVVRGYLSGSLWKDYKKGELGHWGISLPAGLIESDRLPEPIFTPSTKAAQGEHDAPMTPAEAEKLLGVHYQPVVDASLALYRFAAEKCAAVGLLLADTKFEFGIDADGKLLLIDEALTPDSSRYWPADSYQPGGPQPSFDKQFVRDYLETVPGWNKQPPPPELPAEILEKTAAKYRDAFQRLTSQ
jgi:phosphoribosylaminoimidazole-succinocarboxamide synthase